jgi:hypothetical protein
MPEPLYRIGERVLPFSSRLSDEEYWRLVQERSDAKPSLQREQHRTSPLLKTAKLHAPDTSSAASRRVSEKRNPPSLSDAEKEQLFQEFLEWRKRQTDVP